MTFLTRISRILQNIESISRLFGGNSPFRGIPALAGDCGHLDKRQVTQTNGSLLDEIFSPVLWAVPRRRRNVERRRMRKFSDTWFHQTRLKTNIIVCLHCGHHHQASTICGNCYEKVRDETEKMKSAIDSHTYNYDHPRSEVVYLYDDELDQKEMHNGKHIVEMKSNRPGWFQKKLLTKSETPTDS